MQYREEILEAANDIYKYLENRRVDVINQIQLHAINQIKDGFTSFRINHLDKSEEKYLMEWADMTNADVKINKFKIFEDSKRFIVRQYIVELKDSMNLDSSYEGETLILE